MKSRRSLAGALCLMAGLAPAMAADRWEEAAGGAVAILPVPLKTTSIVGGSLACAEQRWSLRLRAERADGAGALAATGTVTIDATEHAAKVEQGRSDITIAVTAEQVEALKDATRLTVKTDDETPAVAVFSLRGSRAVIEAIAPRCSPIDMSAYEAVALGETGPAPAPAEELLAEEAGLFRAATGKEPSFSAAMLDLAEGRGLLFAALCGSTNYYGTSGCTLRGYARDTALQPWREVYSSEGMALYLDRKAPSGGWPGLVTLPAGATEPIRWSFAGDAYEASGEMMAEDANGADPVH